MGGSNCEAFTLKRSEIMIMIVYLEGPDGSGKSTLANEIAKYLKDEGYEVDRFAERNVSTHPTRPYRLDKKHLLDELKYMERDTAVHILDRGPLSDVVYRVFDNYDPVATMTDYLNFFASHAAIIIYCRTSNAEKAMNDRGDDNPVALTRHKEISKVYDIVMASVAQKSIVPMFVWDYTASSQLDVINWISQRVHELTADCKDGTCGRPGCIRCQSGGLD